MEVSKYQILKEIEKETDLNKLVSILEVTANKLEINTISEMARKNKALGIRPSTPNGIISSKRYTKINIGIQLLCLKNNL